MKSLCWVVAGITLGGACAAAQPSLPNHNVVWHSPSADASGAMPLGNGDIAASVYAIGDGDLYLLLAKNDALTFCGDIFKTGRVRVSLDPNPFAKGMPFKQTLDLQTGAILFEAGGVTLRVWADANKNVYHVEIDAPREITVTAAPDLWRRGLVYCNFNKLLPDTIPADPPQDTRIERDGRILWFYSVGDHSVHPADLKAYNVEHTRDAFPDPFRFNTFGNLLELRDASGKLAPLAGDGGGGEGTRTFSVKGKRFDVRVYALTRQTPTPEREWAGEILRLAAKPLDTSRDWKAHCAWWKAFWERSWIFATDTSVEPALRGQLSGEADNGTRTDEDAAALVSQSYNVSRYIMACQSRGTVQAKFNGGLFTQQLRGGGDRGQAYALPDGSSLTHEDDRLWGRRFTFQNQRLLYWPLLMSGDFDLLQVFFDQYTRLLPMRTAITKAWFGHGGAYFRENLELNGAERDCDHGFLPPKTKPGEKYDGWYHDYYFTCGLETVAMMLDRVRYTRDATFRDGTLVPFAREVLAFFDQHYPRDADGKLRLEPAQVLETYWVAVNPAPDVAGLRFCLDGLLAMGAGTPSDKRDWTRLRAELPDIPMKDVDGRKAIAPASEWDRKQNMEDGELYPVFPFRCFGLALGSADIVDWTLRNTANTGALRSHCWAQNEIDWALAGNAPEAAKGLAQRFRTASAVCRFPMFGREDPDSCPDFDHFGAGAVALQRMLVQEDEDGKLFLFPAWPDNWDVDFRLHVSGKAIVTGRVKNGKVERWDITPASRKKNAVLLPLQKSVCADSAIPHNSHPLRIGADQDGKNVFKGEIARASLIRAKLTPGQIEALAKSRAEAVTLPTTLLSKLGVTPGESVALGETDLDAKLTFEAWVKPGANEAGRIFDKLTPSKDDGILIDTYPNLSVRIIAGHHLVKFPENTLTAGEWQHLAVIVQGPQVTVYLNGKRLLKEALQ